MFRGIIAASILPMTESAEIDEPSLRSYVNWLLDQGVSGLAINADTGEGHHLTREERIRVIEIVKEEVKGKVPIIAGLAASFTSQAIQLAQDAERAGADALLVFPISDFRGYPQDSKLIAEYYRAVASDISIPLVAFQLEEGLGGVTFTRETLAALLEIPEVVALKDASFNAKTFVETCKFIKQRRPDVAVLTGDDTFIFESMLMGADGALIGFGCLATSLQVEMFEAVKRHDYDAAAQIWDRIGPLANLVFSPPLRDYRARIKEALVALGLIPRSTVRLPLLPLRGEEVEEVKAALHKAGLLDISRQP